MRVFKTSQIREIDLYTIEHEPVASIDLMERASNAMHNWILKTFDVNHHYVVVAGPGNNGGDGLALARMLAQEGIRVRALIIRLTDNFSEDCLENYKRLNAVESVSVREITSVAEVEFTHGEVIIDALFGSGLNRPLDGLALEAVSKINQSDCRVISLDMPSGLFGEDNSANNPDGIVKADHTVTLQFPKISFFFAENEIYTGEWHIVPIGLSAKKILETPTNYSFVRQLTVKPWLLKRKRQVHKGNFGHALLIAGSSGKMGAAILAAKACLRTGVGLLTAHIPADGNCIMQSALPEAMVNVDKASGEVSELPEMTNYSAIGAGPGLGMGKGAQTLIQQLLSMADNKPLVLDADALNIISENKELLDKIPPMTILTPHPKEFDRLAGDSENGYDRHLAAINFAKKYSVIVVLKGAYTMVATPEGSCWFNSSGNSGMATGGSGDVLTGMILSLLAQGYEPVKAAVAGVYLHGSAGDYAALKRSQEGLIAGDIVEGIGKAFLGLRNS